MRNAVMFIVAGHMGEEIDNLFKTHKNGHLETVKVRGDTMTNAMMEDVVLMQSACMREALMCLMASYYIFHVDYPPLVKRTLTFYQYEVLKVVGAHDKKDNVMKAFYKKLHQWQYIMYLEKVL